ncbi:EamA family transporter RarD [Sphingoaurantiacus capsulatus]|uniref:EamA family transporter RarD n=1 Tax=Sphingoaurantiacus capsulatus TaxID=1771310 RepID=A0ABV7X8Y5_9SPHN
MDEATARDRASSGLLLGLGAYLIWGFLPAFLKLLGHVSALEILAHRIIWSVVLLAGTVLILKRQAAVVAVLKSPRLVGLLAITALLVGVNWLIYIWAVNSAHVLEASLGYFINPLLNVALGMAVLREKLDRAQVAAVALAAVGVIYLGAAQGDLPWISLGLAFTFSLYGLLRKMAPVDPVTGLLVETLLMAPPALLWIGYVQAGGHGSFGVTLSTDLLLVAAGGLTMIPLLLFAAAAKRLRYATLGLLQFLAPSLQFALAVFAYHEPVTRAHAVAFAFIWTGLLIFAADAIRAERSRRLASL